MTTVESDAPFDRVYGWKNNERRQELHGRRCRVLVRGSTMNAYLVEFESGEKVIVSRRALRKVRA